MIKHLCKTDIFQTSIDSAQNHSAQMATGLLAPLHNDAVVVFGEMSLPVAIQVAKTLQSKVLEVNHFAFIQPL